MKKKKNFKKKSSKSSKNINKYDYTINNNYLQNDKVKKQQSLNLDNINEEFDENNDNNDNSPLNNMVIKSVKLSTPHKKSMTSEYSSYLNDKNSKNLGGTYSSFRDITITPSLDSSSNDDKKDNIEKIFNENKQEEIKKETKTNEIKKSNSLGEEIKLNISTQRSRSNSKNFKKKTIKIKKKTSIKPKIKIDNSLLQEKNDNPMTITNLKINKKSEIPKANRKEKTIPKNNELIKSHSENKKIKYSKKINLYKSYNINNIPRTKKNNEIENKRIDSNNVKIFKNNTIKNYLNNSSNQKKSKTIIKSNKSYECPKINNNDYSSLISLCKNSEKPFFNNTQFNTFKTNKKNNDFQIKNTYYQIFQLQSIKREELKNNNNQNIFLPKDIPIISNSLIKHSFNSEKRTKKEKLLICFKNKKNCKEEKEKKNINLELKIIPANFKVSKKIQVN